MCKLCNTDKPTIKTLTKRAGKDRKLILNTVYDYLGEYVCDVCCNSLHNSLRDGTGSSLDRLILLKLYRNHRAFTSTQLSRIKDHNKRSKKSVLGCTVCMYYRIDNTIHTVYVAVLRMVDRKVIYGKSRNTLEEAVEDKIELIKKHKNEKSLHLFIKSIKKYNQKLKELENETEQK